MDSQSPPPAAPSSPAHGSSASDTHQEPSEARPDRGKRGRDEADEESAAEISKCVRRDVSPKEEEACRLIREELVECTLLKEQQQQLEERLEAAEDLTLRRELEEELEMLEEELEEKDSVLRNLAELAKDAGKRGFDSLASIPGLPSWCLGGMILMIVGAASVGKTSTVVAAIERLESPELIPDWATFYAAEGGHTETALKIVEKGGMWHEQTTAMAAGQGHKDFLVAAVQAGCPWHLLTVYRAARFLHPRTMLTALRMPDINGLVAPMRDVDLYFTQDSWAAFTSLAVLGAPIGRGYDGKYPSPAKLRAALRITIFIRIVMSKPFGRLSDLAFKEIARQLHAGEITHEEIEDADQLDWYTKDRLKEIRRHRIWLRHRERAPEKLEWMPPWKREEHT